ncbi:unnamed protein product [Candida parapsilosis]
MKEPYSLNEGVTSALQVKFYLQIQSLLPTKTHAQDKLNIDEAPFLLPADDDDDEEEEEEEPDPLPPPTLVEF